jgi:hypothetical protein
MELLTGSLSLGHRGDDPVKVPQAVEAEVGLVGDTAQPLARVIQVRATDRGDLDRGQRLAGPLQDLAHVLGILAP